jgi:hypothetical protein
MLRLWQFLCALVGEREEIGGKSPKFVSYSKTELKTEPIAIFEFTEFLL